MLKVSEEVEIPGSPINYVKLSPQNLIYLLKAHQKNILLIQKPLKLSGDPTPTGKKDSPSPDQHSLEFQCQTYHGETGSVEL